MKARWVAAVLVLWASCGEGRPADQLPKGAIRVDELGIAQARKSVATQARLLALLRAKSPLDIAALCNGQDPLSAESALSQWLDEIGGRADLSDNDSAALEQLTGCTERVFAPHPESAGQWWVPVFPLGARAQALLALDADRDQARALAAAWSSRQAHKQQAAASERSLRMAIDALEPDARVALAADPTLLPSAALVPLARLTWSDALYQDVMQRASDADLAPALSTLLAKLPAPARAAWLQRVARRPALTSTAVVNAQAYLADPAIAAWLHAQLDEQSTGASAAQALSGHLGIDQWLAMATDPQASPLRRLHAVLAVRLRNDPQAEQRLRGLAQDGKLPATLTAELLR